MDQDVLDGLNELLSYEYTSIIQLMQHSYILQGIEREAFASFLRNHAKESLDHAAELGDKIIALDGVPTVQVGTVRQSTDWREMLQQDLDQHHEVVAKVDALVQKCEERRYVALRVLLERMSEEETKFIEDLERALSLKQTAIQREKGKVPRVKVG
ncbi:MAG: ferritin-like domain-containing protein [Armatimonadetes bacterium]|nr:ferritin-like domain-containing protein [Armatimonadota bacterium]